MKPRMILFFNLLVIMMLACSLTSRTTDTQSPTQPPQVGGNSSPNPVPVSLNDGLASLNSYEMTVRFYSFGPDPSQTSTTEIQRFRSNQDNTSSTSIKTIGASASDEEPANSESTIIQIGNDQCSGSDLDGWSWTSTSPAEAEMQGLITNMVGLTPLIDNPVFLAAETVNGIATNHFTFKVSGLGASSGAVVNINQGDYWLAIDGQYIVRYVLIVETSMAAEAKVIHEEVSIELKQVNQPVNVSFPQGCIDASQETPEPG